MGVLSDNPANTVGRARKNHKSLTYPLNEVLSSGLRLRFVEYNRFNPSDDFTEEETASIMLPLPITVPENYSLATSSHNMNLAGNITNNNWDKLKGIGEGSNNWLEDAKQLSKLGISAAASEVRGRRLNPAMALSGIGMAAGSSDINDTIAAFVGVVRNPHTTVIFNGVNLRNINFEWRFSPRSQQESDALKSIYDTVKLRSHPEELTSGFALNYPDLVYFEFTGKVAEYMPKFQKAFITNINITPDSSSGMSLFKSGAPTTYNFQISATEISIVTRNTLEQQINGTS